MVRRDKRKERPRERERVLLTQLDAIAEQPRAPRMPVKELPQGFYKIWY